MTYILRKIFDGLKKTKVLILFFSIMFLILFIFNTQSYFEFKKDIKQRTHTNWDQVIEYINGTKKVNICYRSECYNAYVEVKSGYVLSLTLLESGEQFIFIPAKINPDGTIRATTIDNIDLEFTLDSKIIDQAIEDWYEIDVLYRE
jgi:hypothetical protein